MQPSGSRDRQRFEAKGIVQGVGFRPFVCSLARRLGLSGFVRNNSAGVLVEVEGELASISQFVSNLLSELPPLAQIHSLDVTSIPLLGGREFQIIESEPIAAASTAISPDVATCAECLAELTDPDNRRYRYPFINCTNCGPRYTIVRDVPYDRPLTTMSVFSMCEACAHEYRDRTDRRYHAQPNACPECGPTVWFVRREETNHRAVFSDVFEFVGERAIEAFHNRIDTGDIIAIKGVGGFHLACAADSSIAIRRLRERKGRVDKPLAIMVADIATARAVAKINVEEERLLCSRQRPVVLLRRRRDGDLSDLVAPGNDFVGIMLPYSPLHALLIERGPLVMTSGNVSEEPIVRTNEEAFERLNSLADAFLLHNREIHVVCDDSVVRVVGGRELPIRRSRGYAPMPVRLEGNTAAVLAVGGQLKATFCLTKDDYAYMSPHLGDMGNLETLDAFRRAVDHFQTLFRIEPKVVACDMHPGYLSSQWAHQHARANGLDVFKVQHHHAHIASVLAEHGVDRAQRVIGISFDGTGYGTDGAIWGGEVLIASCRNYSRWAHLKYSPLPGGDASVKHPYRVALGHLWAAGLAWDERLPCVLQSSEKEQQVLRRQLERNLNCVQTSSMGRLFDAVAALIGIRQSVTYEAQAAIEMEGLSGELDAADAYPFSVSGGPPFVIDTAPMLETISKDVIRKVEQSAIISRFQITIAQMIIDQCSRVRRDEGIDQVALSGGVFQNVLLLRHTMKRLEELGFDVLAHRVVPPNDGGLALGQAIIAAANVESN